MRNEAQQTVLSLAIVRAALKYEARYEAHALRAPSERANDLHPPSHTHTTAVTKPQ